jgi:putative phosphotransacetylase
MNERPDIQPDEGNAVPTGGPVGDEQMIRLITNRVIEQVQSNMAPQESPTLLPVGISARHCHLTQQALNVLYGPGAELHPYRPLRQPGNYAAKETLIVVGPRMRALENVRVLGPLRDYCQVELSRTDGFTLGLDLPVRDSGDHDDTPGLTLVGPKGTVTLQNGVIRAGRHMHVPPDVAVAWGLTDQQYVRVEFEGQKGVIYNNVLCRLSSGVLPEIHLDTDDANAADLQNGDMLRLIV